MITDPVPVEFEQAEVEETRLGILNLFHFIKAKESEVRFTYSGIDYLARVVLVEDDHVLLDVFHFQETQDRRGTLRFEALNRYYYTQLFILRSNENGVFIRIPLKLWFLARRLHPRVRFDDLFMRFIILYSPIMKTREQERSLESYFPKFMQEVLNDAPSISIIYQMFVDEVARISPDYEIKILSDDNEDSEENESFDVIEKLMLEKGMSVLVEDVSQTTSYTEGLDSDRVISPKAYFDSKMRELGEYKGMLQVQEKKKEDMRSFLVSYLLTPFSMYGKIIGYIKVFTHQFDKRMIVLQQAETMHTVAELFSYALTKVSLRRAVFDAGSKMTRIVNISVSGLLMELEDEYIYRYLQTHKRLKMLVPLAGDEVELYGEVVRYYEHNNYFYMGVMFFKNKPGDALRLEQFIFENLHYEFF